MSFVDKVKYINQLAVVDEFGGQGHADKITRFCIIFRVTDGSGNEIEVTTAEVEEAVKAKNIVLCDYLDNKEYTLGIAAKNPDNCDFIVAGRQYKNNTNLIVVDMGRFSDNTSLCVSLRNDDGSVIASTTYLSDFPSCFFLNKKTTADRISGHCHLVFIMFSTPEQGADISLLRPASSVSARTGVKASLFTQE